MNINYEDIKLLVVQVGKEINEQQKQVHVYETKENDDIVTDSDLYVERMIYEEITSKYPHHGFVSEEMGEINADREFVWVLDPIDGTKHYRRGSFLYSISLALQRNNELIYGIVYIPKLNYLYSSIKYKGAYLNDNRIFCSKETSILNSIICMEIPSHNSESIKLEWSSNKIDKLIRNVCRIRIIGVGSIGLCMCADGQFDGYLNIGSNSEFYDYAAGQLILQEAGGKFSYNNGIIIAGPSVIHDKLLMLINE